VTLPRFLAPLLDPASAEVTLPAEEARHLTRVLRLGPGARVAVFDGRGCEFIATVAAASRDRVTLRLDEAVARVPAPRVGITLAQAILKGDKMDDVIRDATMLGVEEIVPLLTEHVSVKPSAVARGKPEERWGRVAVASAKQCRCATIPAVRSPAALDAWLAARTQLEESKLMFVEPNISGRRVRAVRDLLSGPVPSHASILVGPEGGWASREVETATRGGYVPVTLGRLTLRADAVAIVALSALTTIWEE
jgi:16S rRNA (uracil1498-N3)-methyltransferase